MPNTYNSWSEKEEAKLIELYKQGLTNKEIMEQLDRNKNSITHRIAILKQREILISKRRTKTNEENYYSNANRIIENFKNKKLKPILEGNHQLILNMDRTNEAEQLAPNTRSNYIRYIHKLALILNKDLLVADLEKDIKLFLIENKTQIYKSCIKGFYEELVRKHPDKQNLIEIYNFLNKKKRSRKDISIVEEKEHLVRQEVVKLVAATKGNSLEAIRNRALISVTYDSGARISELLAVTQQNTKTDDKVPRLWLPISKTKPRYSHMLKFSLPYLLEWIKVHEFWNNPESPLFYSLSTANYGDPLAVGRSGQILRRALKIAGIKKKISLHSLRHSKAYHCAEEGMLVSEANKLFGWGRTSGMFHYYTSVTQKESEQKELERAGQLTPEQLQERKKERNAFVMKECLRCHTKVLPDQFVCGKCGLALTKHAAVEELKKEKEKNKELERLKTNVLRLLQSEDNAEAKKEKEQEQILQSMADLKSQINTMKDSILTLAKIKKDMAKKIKVDGK